MSIIVTCRLFGGFGRPGTARFNRHGWLFAFTGRGLCGGLTAATATGADQKTLIQIVEAAGVNRRLFAVGRVGRCLFATLVLMAVIVVLLLAAMLLLVARLFFVRFVNQTLIVFSVLQIAFSQYAVTGSGCVFCQRLVFLGDLEGIATNAHIGAVAVKGVNARVDPALATAAMLMMMLVVATAAIIAATAITTVVLVVPHAFCFTSLDG